MSENKSGIKFLLVLAAIAALIILANFIKKSVSEYELKNDYNTAIQLIEDGNYSDAEYKLYALGDYEDSKVLTNYAGYMRSKSNIYSAHHYMSCLIFLKAITAFLRTKLLRNAKLSMKDMMNILNSWRRKKRRLRKNVKS